MYNSAEEVLDALIFSYFVLRDTEKVVACVTDDIEWIGTERSECISGKNELRIAVPIALKKLPKGLKPSFTAPHELKIDDNASVLSFTGTYLDAPEIPYNFNIRASVCCVKFKNGWLIKSLHLSVPNIGGENYVLKRKLSKAEERKQILSDSIPGGSAIYRLKKDGRVEAEFVSERLAKICGYNNADELLASIYNDGKKLIFEDDRDMLRLSIMKSLGAGEPIFAKYQIYTKDRKLLPITMNANAISDETLADDEVAVLYAVHTLPSLQELREQRHYRTIIDMLGVAYWEWTKESGFFSTTNFGKYAMSLEPFENIKNNIVSVDAIHPDDIEKLKAFFQTKKEHNDRSTVTVRMKLVDGSYRWTELFGFRGYSDSGETTRMSCVMRDVDDEYGHSFMMNNMLNAIPGGIGLFVFKEHLGCEYYSDGFAKMAGLSRAEMDKKIAENTVLSSIIDPTDYPDVKAVFADKTPKGLPLNLTFRYIHSDGSVRWMHLTAEKMGERDGYPAYYCVFTTPTEETELYRNMTEDSANGVAVFECKTRENIYINSAAVKFYGLQSIGETNGRSIVHLLEEHNLPHLLTWENVFTLCKDKYTVFHVERNGRYLAVKGKRVNWAGVEAYILYISDETAEHDREMHLENLLNLIPTGILTCHVDEKGAEQIFANNGFYKTFGVSKEDYSHYIGSNFFDTVLDIDKAKINNVLEQLKSGKNECDVVFRSVMPGRDIIYARMLGIVADRSDGGFTLYSGFTDVTEQVNVQNRQKELFDTVPSGILEFNFDGTYLNPISANQTLINMIGYTSEEFYAKDKWKVSEVVHPEDYNLLTKARDSVELGKGMTYDFRLLNKQTGKYRWVSCDFTIIERSNSGLRVISAFLDTDEKRKLEDASAAKSRFLSRMSHEIRTPINAIIGIAELEKQDVESGEINPDTIEKYSKETFAASEYLLTLVNDILDTSRIENNQIQIQQNIVNAEQYLSDIKTLVAPLIKEKNIKFNFLRKSRLHETYIGDGVRVKQILLNIMNNAFKFTPYGGTVSFTCETIRETESEATLKFTISDTGIGMSKEFQETMFTPFAQENSETTSPFTGTGLGLSIAKNLAQKMGGDIVCFSEKGKGSTFEVTIVAGIATENDEKKLKKQEHLKLTENVDFKGIRILVCEDHPLNQKIIKALLERRKCNIEIAADGAIGLDMFRNSPAGYYSVILMDIRMPNMDGLQATKAIRSLSRNDAKTIPIVAMSANAYEEDVQKSIAAGMDCHLAKPVDAEKLYNAIASYIK